MEKDHGVSGIKGFDFIKIARMLCIDYPAEILKGILALLEKREEENVDFDEFLCGIRTILMYDSYFEEMETIFKHLDFMKRNKIKKDDLMQAAFKLRDESIGPHELRVPSAEDLDKIYNQMSIDEDGSLNYDEYQILMFRATLQESEKKLILN